MSTSLDSDPSSSPNGAGGPAPQGSTSAPGLPAGTEAPGLPSVGGIGAGLLSRLLHLIYSLTAFVLVIGSSPWWIARSFVNGHFRAMVLGRLTIGLPRLPRTEHPRILIHGVSVGEVKAAQPIVRAIQRDLPQAEVVVSATTGTGLEVATKLFEDLVVVGFPVDFRAIVGRFLRRIRPTCVVLIELELWPNFVRAASGAGVPVVVANGRITDRSFRRYAFFRSALPQFHLVSLICAQDETYARRFALLARSSERVVVTGNVKGDGLKIGAPWTRAGRELALHAEPLRATAELAGISGAQLVVVAGSTHEPEETWVSRAVLAGAPGARLVLVPRHPGRGRDILNELLQIGLAAQLWTSLRAGDESVDPARPLVVDTIGELEQFYALADIVFVGGSLIPHGGQNMLEPAGLGRPVVYGPNVANFSHEAELLEQHGASVRVADPEQLESVLAQLVADPQRRERMAAAGVGAAESQRGASDLTLRALERWNLV